MTREVNDRAERRLVPVRAISAYLANNGHSLSPTAIHRHLRNCRLPQQARAHELPVESRAGLVALAVRDVIGWRPHRKEIVERLVNDGLADEAKIIDEEYLGQLPPAMPHPQFTPAGHIIDARYVVGALGNVLRHDFPETSRAIAAELADLRAAPDLIETFEWLASEASAASADRRRVGSGPSCPAAHDTIEEN